MLQTINGLWGLSIAAVLIVSALGCEAVQQAQQAAKQAGNKDKMKQMALAFHNHHDTFNKGPAGWDDFIAWAEKSDADSATVLKELRADGVILFGDVTIRDAVVGASNSILAYEPAAPQSGGNVALLDGSVMQMSADQFNQMMNKQKADAPKTVANPST